MFVQSQMCGAAHSMFVQSQMYGAAHYCVVKFARKLYDPAVVSPKCMALFIQCCVVANFLTLLLSAQMYGTIHSMLCSRKCVALFIQCCAVANFPDPAVVSPNVWRYSFNVVCKVCAKTFLTLLLSAQMYGTIHSMLCSRKCMALFIQCCASRKCVALFIQCLCSRKCMALFIQCCAAANFPPCCSQPKMYGTIHSMLFSRKCMALLTH